MQLNLTEQQLKTVIFTLNQKIAQLNSEIAQVYNDYLNFELYTSEMEQLTKIYSDQRDHLQLIVNSIQ